MVVMLLLLGFLAFLPGYITSVEDRLHEDVTFKPLSVLSNLHKSKRARPFLTWFGLVLISLGIVIYIFSGVGHKTYSEDMEAIVGGLGVVWLYFLYGFSVEEQLRRERGSFDIERQWFASALLNEWCQIIIKASKNIGLMVLFFILVFCIRTFIQGV